jgi:exopolysaccharide biosynthesis polyprenyl glycosylphosphotransferase
LQAPLRVRADKARTAIARSMSTRESIAPRETPLLRPAPSVSRSWPGYARFLAWSPLHKLVYLGGDLLALTLAHMLAFRAAEHLFHIPVSALNPFEYHRVYIPFFAVILYLFEGYKSPELRRPEQELERSCKAVAVSFLGLVLFNFVVFRSEVFSRYLLVSWFIISCVFLVTVRFGLRVIHEKLWKSGFFRRRAVLIGPSAGLREYQQLLALQRHHGYEVAGALLVSDTPESAPEMALNIPVLGSLDQWEKCLAATGANVLIVAYPVIPGGAEWLGELLRRCKQLHVDVELYSGVLATANLSYEHDEYAGCFRFYARPRWSVMLQRFLKRSLDVAIGLGGSVLTLLLTPIMGLLIKLEDGGPVFYRSPYVRPDCQNGYYLKFRTMRVDADQILTQNPELLKEFEKQYKLTSDPRVTRVGRFLRKYSLDEFPSFFSILRGDISLVGPRTITQAQRERYGSLLPKLLSVKPGLTGFWQVMGRQTTSYEDKIHLDMFYIDHWSIWLDLLIVFKTFWAVLRAEGAY